MQRSLYKLILVLLIAVSVMPGNIYAQSSASSTNSVVGPLRDVLEKKIQSKAQELEQINKALLETQKNLSETKSEKVTLKNELNNLEYTGNQLKLNIQSDEVVLQKLNLEIQSLTFDIQDIKSSIEDKKVAVLSIFKQLQRNDQSNVLLSFLQRRSLAQGILEVKNLNDLNTKLNGDILSLKDLHEQLVTKAQESDAKKNKTLVHQKNLENRKIILQDQKKERETILTQTKNKETVYEKQLADLKKIQQGIADEIESINAELRLKIDLNLLPSARAGVLGLPLENEAIITQGYGATSFARTAYPGKAHNGIDFKASVGTPVLAAEAGVVVAVGDQDLYCNRGAYGRFIVINHNNNLTTLYSHLSRYIVKKGDQLTRGQLIGYSGRTGYATGPHLHLTVFAQPTFYMGGSRTCGPMPFGGDLNPLGYFELGVTAAH